MSKKQYFKAFYRIIDEVYNQGYICIDGDTIIGVFTCDVATISFKDNYMIFSLKQYDFPTESYTQTDNFICTDIDFFEIPGIYDLECDDTFLELTIGNEISNPTEEIKEMFQNLIS